MTVHGTEAGIIGTDPRAEALELLDGAWRDGLHADLHEATGGRPAPPSTDRLRQMQIDAAKISALIYVGDQLKDIAQIQSARGASR